MAHPYTKLSIRAKGMCVRHVLKHLEDDFFNSPAGEVFTDTYAEELNGSDEQNSLEKALEAFMTDPRFIQQLDWFILFGKTHTGERVLEVVRNHTGLFEKEIRHVLQEWEEKAFSSVFEVSEIASNHLRLFDVVGEVTYAVYSNDDDLMTDMFPNIESRWFLYTHLAPVHGVWFISGIARSFPPDREQVIYETYVADKPPEALYRNNPNKLERAFRLQKEQYDFFIQQYGNDEVIVSGKELPEKERIYYDAWHKAHGLQSRYTPYQLPEQFLEADNVGIVMDEQEGLHHFIEYGTFKGLFAHPKEKPPHWEELVRGYLEDETLPAFVFRRMKERYPDIFREIMHAILPRSQKSLDLVNDFDKLMDIYKPDWRTVYPSVHPISERFKKYAYAKSGVGRNDPCVCQSGKKFKQCCGK